MLLTAAAHGDDSAWTALVERHSALLWSVARSFRMNTADAADAVQITWLRLVENIDRIHDPDRLPGWLATTVRRECLRVLRRSGRERAGLPLDGTDVPEAAGEQVDAQLLREERDAAVRKSLGTVPEPHRRLLHILVMPGEPPTYATVSRVLDMPIGSIGSARRRALDQLRLALTAGAALDA